MKQFLIVVCLLVCQLSTAQQGKLSKADKLYSKVSYSEAAEIYEDLIGSEVDNPKMRSRLANCYYQVGDMQPAMTHFLSVVNTPEATSEDFYKYSQTLKELGNYAESDVWMHKFHESVPNDSRGIKFIETQVYLDVIKAQPEYFDIVHLNINTSHSDFGGYPLGKKIFFVSNRKPNVAIKRSHQWNNEDFLDLYGAERNENTGELINPKFHDRSTNSKFHEGPICLSPDGKMVYFTRNNIAKGSLRRDQIGIQNLKLYQARVTDSWKWVDEKELSINSVNYSVGHPSISKDGKTLYFASDMPGGFGGADIYKIAINSEGIAGTPINLGPEINTEGQEMFPWMSPDGVLYCSSDGHIGLGGLDVFACILNSDGSLKKLTNLGNPINGVRDDFAFVMLADSLTGYFSSNRSGGDGDDDIYSFKMIQPLFSPLIVKGIITDEKDDSILAGSEVKLFDEEGNLLDSVISDKNGIYEFQIEPEKTYKLEVEKDEYIGSMGNVSTIDLPEGVTEINKDLDLSQSAGITLYAKVTDGNTNEPIEGVELVIRDNSTGEIEVIRTPASGDKTWPLPNKLLGDNFDYTLQVRKEGYIPKRVDFQKVIDRLGQFDVLVELDFTMTEIKGDLIVINPIYFDLNSSYLRPESKIQLDRIVEILNDNPKVTIELGSHTDCRQTIEYNIWLSDRRAKRSAAYIKSKITNPERIFGKGYGESRLLNDCPCEGEVVSECSEDMHQLNRRTEFKIINAGGLNILNNSSDSFDK